MFLRFIPVMCDEADEVCASFWEKVEGDDLVLLDCTPGVGVSYTTRKVMEKNLVNMIVHLKAEEVAVELDGTFKLCRTPRYVIQVSTCDCNS